MRLKQGFVNAYLPFHHFRSKVLARLPSAPHALDLPLP